MTPGDSFFFLDPEAQFLYWEITSQFREDEEWDGACQFAGQAVIGDE